LVEVAGFLSGAAVPCRFALIVVALIVVERESIQAA